MKLGQLEIDIMANLARLQGDMDQVKNSVGGAMKDVEQAVGMAKGAFVALTGVASAAAFVHIVQGAIEAKARLYDLSLQTGISVEQLSSLARVAKYADADIANVAAASNKLAKALSTTNEDSAGAAAALKALGVNFDEIKRAAPDERMRLIAEAFEQVKEGGDKSAAAMLLFGKTGATLLPFLKELAERQGMVGKETTQSALQAKEFQDNLVALKEAGEDFRRMLATSLLPSLVELTRGLIEAKNAFGSMWQAVMAFGKEGGVWSDNAKAVAHYRGEIDGLNESLKRQQAIVPVNVSQQQLVSNGIRRTQEQIADLQRYLRFYQSQVDQEAMSAGYRGQGFNDPRRLDRNRELNLKVPAAGGAAGRDDFAALMKQLQEKIGVDQAELDALEKLTAAQQLQAKIFTDIDKGYAKLTVAQKLVVDSTLQELLSIEKLTLERDRNRKQIDEDARDNQTTLEHRQQQVDAIRQSVEQQKLQNAQYGLSRAELQALDQQRTAATAGLLRERAALLDDVGAQGQLAQLYRDQAAALDELIAARAKQIEQEARDRNDPYAGARRAVKQYLQDVSATGDATAAAVSRGIGSLEDTLTQAFSKGKLDAASFIDTVMAEFMRLAAVRPLLQSLLGSGSGGGDWLSRLFSAAGSSAGGGGGVDYGQYFASGGVFGGGGSVLGSPTLFRFAQGGRFSLGVAGEAGPEAVMPLTRGANGKLGVAAQGSAPSVQITQNITVGSEVSRNEVMNAMGRARDEAIAAVADHLQRNHRAFA